MANQIEGKGTERSCQMKFHARRPLPEHQSLFITIFYSAETKYKQTNQTKEETEEKRTRERKFY